MRPFDSMIALVVDSETPEAMQPLVDLVGKDHLLIICFKILAGVGFEEIPFECHSSWGWACSLRQVLTEWPLLAHYFVVENDIADFNPSLSSHDRFLAYVYVRDHYRPDVMI